jgi:hypothetical protein
LNNRNVSLHFNTIDNKGEEDVVVLSGIAKIETKADPVNKNGAYMRKYRSGIKRLGATPQKFAEMYSTGIRIKFTSLRGW